MIKYKPQRGAILICDYDGSVHPEMNKRRLVIVVANKAHNLCIVVPLSTTRPSDQKDWHYVLQTPEPFPAPYDALGHWVKCDMINTVSYDRLFFPFIGKDAQGKRIYDMRVISDSDLKCVLECVAQAIFSNSLDRVIKSN